MKKKATKKATAKNLQIRLDAELDRDLMELESRLNANRSALVRIAVKKLLKAEQKDEL